MASSSKTQKTPDPEKITHVKIFPPIGIARIGDSGFDLETGKPDLDTLEYFVPPEVPGIDEVEHGKFREDPEKRAERVKRKVKEEIARIAKRHNLDLRDESDLQVENVNGRSLNEIKMELTNIFDDHHDRIKRQGVRFRVYAYDENGENLGEITTQGGYKLTWTVHVANHKASFELFRGMYEKKDGALRNPDVQGDRKPEDRDRLIVDPGPKTISSPDINTKIDISGAFQGSRTKGVEVHLGQLRTNEQGHLIFIGGAGYSQCVTNRRVPQPDIVSEFDSADWVDDTCDGWVKVVVDHNDIRAAIESSSKATVLSAPPKFAWGVRSPTTWYDLIADIYAKQPDRWVDEEGNGVNFYRHIWPVLHSAHAISWTNKDAFDGHGVSGKGNFMYIEEKLRSKGPESKVFRQAVFNRLRAPDYKALTHATTRYMPRLSGNDGDAIEPGFNLPSNATLPPIRRYAALTALQYERFSLWRDGKFNTEPEPWEEAKGLNDVETKYQPLCLTLAALDHTVGEPLFPGIEVLWIARKPEVYVIQVDTDKERVDPPFRINHEIFLPGHLTRGLSLPWQSDFDQCNTHWWPSVRPDDVINERFFTQSNLSEKDFIETVLPHRLRWTRGLRFSAEDTAEYFPGATDMVKYWSKLGFIVKYPNKIKRQNGDMDPAWLEMEREKIVRKDKRTRLPFEVVISAA